MPYLISIVGPTAVGKSRLALTLARDYQTHIISCDSRQIYRYMNIGTAKPSKAELASVPHHFIDILNPDQPYNAGRFEHQALTTLDQLFKTFPVVIAVGGSTLYFQALWEGIDPMPQTDPAIRQELQNTFDSQGINPLLDQLQIVDPITYQSIDKQNHIRIMRALEVYLSSGIPISTYRRGLSPQERTFTQIKIGLNQERALLYEKINQRVDHMIEDGLEAEVKELLNMGFSKDDPALKSIGYQELISHIEGKITKDEAIRLIKRNSRRYAKRQLTFYRKFEDIVWYNTDQTDQIKGWLNNMNLLE